MREIFGSFRFNGFTNLHSTFGRVDVLSAKFKGNYIEVTILDTYDFNKNSKNGFGNIARKIQDIELLNPYFTIVKCRYKRR